MAKIAINGLGRVGRQVLKQLITRYPEVDVVAANDITDEKTLAHLLKYDSNYGTWDVDIEGKEGAIVIGGREVKIFREKDPATLPWGKLGIDIVIESTGVFTDADKARGHITAGAKKVLITAPAKGEDITIVLGVNEDLLDVSKHSIISNASCTTNSLAPVVKVLNDRRKQGRRTGHSRDEGQTGWYLVARSYINCLHHRVRCRSHQASHQGRN